MLLSLFLIPLHLYDIQALDTLGNTKWRINKRVLSIVDRIWSSGGRLADLVDRDDVSFSFLMQKSERISFQLILVISPFRFLSQRNQLLKMRMR